MSDDARQELRTTMEPRSLLVGKSKEVQKQREFAALVAGNRHGVFLTGETGVGKGLLAREIHQKGREGRPFIPILCGSMPDTLLESELFGHQKGSFTDASATRKGLFEVASGGTVFLDEIEDLSSLMQRKLLRVLDERCFRPVGMNTEISFEGRVIAATNVCPQTAVKEGKLREDLYYRLRILPFSVAPLRDRKEDIRELADHFRLQEEGGEGKYFSSATLERMCEYEWPGNLRELKIAVSRGVLYASGEEIKPEHLQLDGEEEPPHLGGEDKMCPPRSETLFKDNIGYIPPLKTVYADYMRLVLGRTGGNRRRAAVIAGLGLRTVQRWIAGENITSLHEGDGSEEPISHEERTSQASVFSKPEEESSFPTFAQVREDYFRRVMERTSGNLREAAQISGWSLKTMYNMVKKLHN